MDNRRDFLKATAFGLMGTQYPGISQFPFFDPAGGGPVIKQPEDAEAVWVRENTLITFHLTATPDDISAVSLLSEELVPGAIIPVHKHRFSDEFFLFSSGSGEITIEEKTFSFKPGTTGFVQKDTFHGIRNTGSEKVIFYFGYTPAGFEGFFREIGTPKDRPFKAKSKVEAEVIAKKYGMVFK
jgi:mannose-6-phosphate isomerase-like protein (cupin superfamily)